MHGKCNKYSASERSCEQLMVPVLLSHFYHAVRALLVASGKIHAESTHQVTSHQAHERVVNCAEHRAEFGLAFELKSHRNDKSAARRKGAAVQYALCVCSSTRTSMLFVVTAVVSAVKACHFGFPDDNNFGPQQRERTKKAAHLVTIEQRLISAPPPSGLHHLVGGRCVGQVPPSQCIRQPNVKSRLPCQSDETVADVAWRKLVNASACFAAPLCPLTTPLYQGSRPRGSCRYNSKCSSSKC